MAVPLRLAGELATSNQTHAVTSPWDGRELARVCLASESQALQAVAAARAALEGGPLPAWRRAEILDRAAHIMSESIDRFARPLSDEAAKPITIARGEVRRCVDTLRFSAAAARTFSGELVPMDASSAGEGRLGFVRRVPCGVVLGITPFNFPLNLVAHKVAPAIAAGCPVIIKPAKDTPLSALELAALLLDECGLPGGWLQVLPCDNDVASVLVEHEDVALITFTGSPRVGWMLKERAPRKHVSLELGNNTPLILEADGDWRRAVEQTRTAGFAFGGQSCISVQRIYAHRSIFEEVVEALVAEVRDLRVGDPADEQTEVSALIRLQELDRVAHLVADAVDGGARVLVGGGVAGRIFEPTVLVDVHDDMRVCREEAFAPLVSVQPYDTLDEALRRANDTEYGLQAGIFTADLGKALRASEALRFGGITVNEIPTWRADQMPYGGLGNSGNTKEGPLYAMREMTEERLVVWKAP